MKTIVHVFVLLVMAIPALASEVYHGFVKDKYYLGRGGIPATFEQVAANPGEVFRNEATYMNLRLHIATYLGRELDDQGFKDLFRSDRVRLTPCVGQINTSGVSDSGQFDWGWRSCYAGEMLIELRLDETRWVVVASQGCYNPIPTPIPQPPVVTFEPTVVRKYVCYKEVTSRLVSESTRSRSGVLIQNPCPESYDVYARGRQGRDETEVSKHRSRECGWVEETITTKEEAK